MGYYLKNAALQEVKEQIIKTWEELELWIEKKLSGSFKTSYSHEKAKAEILASYKADPDFIAVLE